MMQLSAEPTQVQLLESNKKAGWNFPYFLFKVALVNLSIVACIGVLLRAFPFLPSFPFSYKNILHGHSHFAFGGWVMPAIVGLLLQCFPELEKKVAKRHWRLISLFMLTSAYGMLISFPLQGYKAASIFFSTLSIVAGFYFAIVVQKALAFVRQQASAKFLKAGLFYFVLSSIGPFTTGPLIVMGKAYTPAYFNAIYFYLHFQYNGWFLFAVLAMFYKKLEQQGNRGNGLLVFRFLNVACIPAYALSSLWHQPSFWFNIIGGAAAILQCIALLFLIPDLKLLRLPTRLVKTIIFIAFGSLSLKITLQVLSALPSVATLAYQQRNFVIAYLHLVLLGFLSLFLIGWFLDSFKVRIHRLTVYGIGIFIFSFIYTELIIAGWPIGLLYGYVVPAYTLQLVLVSSLLPISIGMICWPILRDRSIGLSSSLKYLLRFKASKLV